MENIELVERKRYLKLHRLGEGTFGRVYKAKDTVLNKNVALKIIKDCEKDTKEAVFCKHEVDIQNSLCHPNIAKISHYSFATGRLEIAMDYYPEGDLGTFLDRNKREKYRIKEWMTALLSAVSYMHSQNYMHRDIKPQNILLTEDGVSLVLADFGCACTIIKSGDGSEGGDDTLYDEYRYTKTVVSLWYRAPELLLGDKRNYNEKIDIWSCGCVFAEMLLAGRPLFPGDSWIDQLYRIYRTLGTPTETIWQGVTKMPNYKDDFPKWDALPMKRVFKGYDVSDLEFELLAKFFVYPPAMRISAFDAFYFLK